MGFGHNLRKALLKGIAIGLELGLKFFKLGHDFACCLKFLTAPFQFGDDPFDAHKATRTALNTLICQRQAPLQRGLAHNGR
jgi:hypothetical protein